MDDGVGAMSKKAKRRHPWIKWFPGDFTDDPRIKMCSRAARSVWHDMLRLMHEATPRGYLMIEGISLSTDQLSNLLGERPNDVRKWLKELHDAGVYSVIGEELPDDVYDLVPHGLKEGTVLSRRMVRDTAKEELDRENGKGGGNPILGAQQVIPGVNPLDNPRREKDARKRSYGDKAQSLEARNQNIPPYPLSGPVNRQAAVVHDQSWEPFRQRAVARFGQGCCDTWLFATVLRSEGGGIVLEAPSAFHLSQIERQCTSQGLHEFFDCSVKLVHRKGVAA